MGHHSQPLPTHIGVVSLECCGLARAAMLQRDLLLPNLLSIYSL